MPNSSVYFCVAARFRKSIMRPWEKIGTAPGVSLRWIVLISTGGDENRFPSFFCRRLIQTNNSQRIPIPGRRTVRTLPKILEGETEGRRVNYTVWRGVIEKPIEKASVGWCAVVPFFAGRDTENCHSSSPWNRNRISPSVRESVDLHFKLGRRLPHSSLSSLVISGIFWS